jgi:2-polyprenyl-3-methyl-5-hydroxy-6-metoxy-1,4-benzoquinol methylase
MRDGVRPCGRSQCANASSRRLTAEQIPALGKIVELRICEECGLGFLDPRLAEDEIHSLYTDDYAYYRDVDSARPGARVRFKYRLAAWRHGDLLRPGVASATRSALARLAERVTGKTITYSLGIPLALGRGTRLLDYGCGSGEWLLHLASLGFRRLCGADLRANPRFVERLSAEGIAACSIDEVERLPDGSFDVIRLEHVLEHLPQPVPTLTLLRRLLVPGGWLVLTVPSILPWREREDLDRSPDRAHLQIPVHLAHHSEMSLLQLLEEAELSVVAMKATKVERFLTAAARRPIAQVTA